MHGKSFLIFVGYIISLLNGRSHSRGKVPLGGLNHIAVDLGHLRESAEHLNARHARLAVVVHGIAVEEHIP